DNQVMSQSSSSSSKLIVERPPTRRATVATTWAGFAKKAFSALILAAVAYYALFRLPFRFPPHERLMSASYTFGFNNSVAVFALVALLGVVTLVRLLRYRKGEPLILFPSTATSRALRSAVIACLVLGLFYAVLTWALYIYDNHSAPWLTWEARHLLYRTWVMDVYKLHPYSEISAEYGPLLTYAPLYIYWLLKPLGVSHMQAYFVCHLILTLCGLWSAYYL